MATVKGFIRSYGAAVRRAERQQQKRAREAAKRYKEQIKQEEIANAAYAVKTYNEYIEMIQSLHKNCTKEVDWTLIENSPPPIKPQKSFENEIKAKEKLNKFRPSFLDKIFNSAPKKIKKLKANVEKGKQADDLQYRSHLKIYQEKLEDWEFLQRLSNGIRQEDPEAYKNTLEYFDPFADMGELGSQISFSITENRVDINLYINSEEVIPNYELKQTSTGKLSKKNMSKSKFNELYQDHICSSVIRVARELFAYIPVKNARINAMGKVLNSSTGYLEEKPILSVVMVPETIDTLNLNAIDPSESMQNFVHNMKFSKVKGFSPVEKVKLD